MIVTSRKSRLLKLIDDAIRYIPDVSGIYEQIIINQAVVSIDKSALLSSRKVLLCKLFTTFGN